MKNFKAAMGWGKEYGAFLLATVAILGVMTLTIRAGLHAEEAYAQLSTVENQMEAIHEHLGDHDRQIQSTNEKIVNIDGKIVNIDGKIVNIDSRLNSIDRSVNKLSKEFSAFIKIYKSDRLASTPYEPPVYPYPAPPSLSHGKPLPLLPTDASTRELDEP